MSHTKIEAKRMFYRIALLALLVAGYFGIDGWLTGNVQSMLATVLPLFIFLVLMGIIFERHLLQWLDSVRIGLGTVVLIGANLTAPREDPDDGPTEWPHKPAVRATGGYRALAGIVCMALFAASVAVVVAIEFVRTTWPHLALH